MNEDDIKQIVDRVLLTIKYAEEPEWNILYDYVTKLQNNWDELYKWLVDYGKTKDILVPVAIVKIKMDELRNTNNE